MKMFLVFTLVLFLGSQSYADTFNGIRKSSLSPVKIKTEQNGGANPAFFSDGSRLFGLYDGNDHVKIKSFESFESPIEVSKIDITPYFSAKHEINVQPYPDPDFALFLLGNSRVLFFTAEGRDDGGKWLEKGFLFDLTDPLKPKELSAFSLSPIERVGHLTDVKIFEYQSRRILLLTASSYDTEDNIPAWFEILDFTVPGIPSRLYRSEFDRNNRISLGPTYQIPTGEVLQSVSYMGAADILLFGDLKNPRKITVPSSGVPCQRRSGQRFLPTPTSLLYMESCANYIPGSGLLSLDGYLRQTDLTDLSNIRSSAENLQIHDLLYANAFGDKLLVILNYLTYNATNNSLALRTYEKSTKQETKLGDPMDQLEVFQSQGRNLVVAIGHREKTRYATLGEFNSKLEYVLLSRLPLGSEGISFRFTGPLSVGDRTLFVSRGESFELTFP